MIKVLGLMLGSFALSIFIIGGSYLMVKLAGPRYLPVGAKVTNGPCTGIIVHRSFDTYELGNVKCDAGEFDFIYEHRNNLSVGE